jgi:peptide/nickel transport system substrate-binding protein
MNKRLVLAGTAIAMSVGLVLTGCSGSATSTKTTAATTLTLAESAQPSDLSVGNFGGGDATIYLSVYDSLLSQNINGVLSPGVASSWKTSSDGKTTTFQIRKGQKFSDGETVDAKAVVASVEVSRKGTGSAGQLKTIKTVSAPNDSTVVITLTQPDASILYQLAGTPGAIGAPKYLTAASSKLTPIGSGPYTFDKSSQTGSLYILKKNPNYWNTKAYPFSTVNFRILADPTAITNAMKSGQLDFTQLNTIADASQYPSPQYHTGKLLPSTTAVIVIDDRAGKVVPALGDVRVRQAINLAFDRKLISEKLAPGSTLTAQMADPNGKIYSKALDDKYKFNVVKAKQLMAEAGYANGFKVTMPSDVFSTQFDSTISQQLGAIGIEVSYETVPIQNLFTKLYAGSYGMFLYFNGFSGSDAKDMGQVLTGSFNPFNYTTPELNTLLEKANSAPASEQAADFRAVNEYITEQGWFAPLVAVGGAYVSSKSVKYTPSVATHINLLPYSPAK